MSTTLTATQAAKRFASILDDLEHGHEGVFYVERRGHRIARIEATPDVPRGARWGEVLHTLTDGPLPDADFAADVDAAREYLADVDDPWARS